LHRALNQLANPAGVKGFPNSVTRGRTQQHGVRDTPQGVIAYGRAKIAVGNVADGGHTAYKAGHGIVLLGVRRGKWFVCYDAVTALSGRFCQDALSDESRLRVRRAPPDLMSVPTPTIA